LIDRIPTGLTAAAVCSRLAPRVAASCLC